jgi:hypothetical protein
MKKMYFLFVYCLLAMSCTVRNATILRYSSENFESLQAGKTGNIKFKKQNVIFLDKSSNSIDT